MQIDGGKICCNVIYFFIYFALKPAVIYVPNYAHFYGETTLIEIIHLQYITYVSIH